LKVALFYFLLFLFHVGDLSTPLEKAQVKIGNLQFFSSPPKPESNCCAEQNWHFCKFLAISAHFCLTYF